MKVLHVVSGMDPVLGGVCQAVRTITAGLAALGVENEIVSLDAPGAAFLQQSATPIHALGPAKGPWAYSPGLRPWLLHNLRRFDAVIVHGLWQYHGYAVRKAMNSLKKRRVAGIPTEAGLPRLLVMPHGMLDPYFQRAADRKLKAIRNWAYWKLLEGQLINQADALLFTCEEERRLAGEPFRPYRPKHTVVVGLGVEQPPAYTTAMREAFLGKCPEAPNEPYLLFISRLHQKKGLDLLLAAYEAVSARLAATHGTHADDSAEATATTNKLPRLVVAGPGLDTDYGKQMQQWVAERPAMRGRVSFPGMLTGAAKWGAFYGCEAFVLPSHQENFGIAVVEALACGKPVLISDKVNIWREITTAGGSLVADDTLAGTQDLLEKWVRLPAAAKSQTSQQAAQVYHQYFAVAPAANRLLAALQLPARQRAVRENAVLATSVLP